MSTTNNWVESIDSPGVYYFVQAYANPNNIVRVWTVEKNHEGDLFVVEEQNSEWDWGPDPSKIAILLPGLWKKVPPITDVEFKNDVLPRLDQIRSRI